MRYHTDSAIDLDPKGSIAVMALSDNIRIDIVNKTDKSESSISLNNLELYQFTIEFNSQHKHRLVLPKNSKVLTLYRSKTLSSDLVLDKQSKAEFCKHRSQENNTIMTEFPSIITTHSPGDVSRPYEAIIPGTKHICCFKSVFSPDMLQQLNDDHILTSLLLGRIVADRTGCYISEVVKQDNKLTFNLLRCSTQFNEGTHDMKESDRIIFKIVNGLIKSIHGDEYPEVNHALFQCYHNHSSIGIHSDKTRDMPMKFIIAFVTFYDITPTDEEKARLRFYLKKTDRQRPDGSPTTPSSKLRWELEDGDFEITLEHGSVVLITDYINDHYTHTIIETAGRATRSSYTMRTSVVKGVWDGEQVLIDGKPMTIATKDERKELKKFYALENTEMSRIVYPSCLKHLTVNAGDMMTPKQ